MAKYDIDRILNARAKILWRLYRHRFIGGKHTDINNLRKGFAKHDYDLINIAIKELVRDGLIIVKPTSYGEHVSINKKRLSEVLKEIKNTEEI